MKATILIISLLVVYTKQSANDLLKVSLYYESLCPDCVAFIISQFYPNYQKIGHYLDIKLIPYGNAQRTNINGTWQFDCQHGPTECLFNKVEGCGIVRTFDQDKALEYVECVESKVHQYDEKSLAKKCAPILNEPADVILKCANGKEGNEVLAKMGAETDIIKSQMDGVPTIVFNDSYDQKLNNDARNDFLKTACKLLRKKPNVCEMSNEVN